MNDFKDSTQRMIAEPQSEAFDDEISLIDIVRFLQRRWRLIGIVTLASSAFALTTQQLQPQSYQTQLNLSIEANPRSSLDFRTGVIPESTLNVSELAVELLGQQALDNLSLSANYDDSLELIQVTLSSGDRETLNTAPDAVSTQFQEDLASYLEPKLDSALEEIDYRREQWQSVIERFDAQIADLPAGTSARQIALEQERAVATTEVATLEIYQQELIQAQDNLIEFAAQVFPTAIVEQTEIVASSRSPLQVAILALIAGFMVGILVAIVREQIPQIRVELAKLPTQKPDRDS